MSQFTSRGLALNPKHCAQLMATSRKIALLFGVENINAIVGWIALLFVARNMGASALGEFSYAMSLIGGFTFLAFFGFRMAHVKRISEGLDLGKCIGTFLSIRLSLISLMLAVFTIFYWYWTDYLGKQFYDIKTEGLLFLVIIYYIIYLLTGVLTSTFSGLKQSARVAIPRIIGTSIRSFLLIGTALMGWGVIWLAASELVGILIIALISLWYFRDYPISKPDKSTFDSYKSYAFPVAAVSIFGIFKKHIDKIFIGVFWAATDVGLYFGVQRIALFIGTMALAIEEMLLPSVSKLHSNKSNNEIRSLVYDAEKYVAMVCIPIVVMTIVWSNEIIFVFISREFLAATRILQILVLASLVRVINRPWSVALRGSNRPDLTSIINIFSSIVSIILMLILVPREIPHLGLDNLPGLGGEGAAIAVLISELILAISLRILCYSYLEMKPQIGFFVQILFATIVGLIMWQIQLNLDVSRWYELFFFSALGGFLYISFLAAVGAFTLQDFNFFWNVMNPKAMTSYVSNELKRK
jgi:O-antigen/teichoic acid export membrane protein